MPSKGFTTVDVPDQSDKCFIVTGANTGIGFEVASALAARGARVLLARRDKAKAQAAMTRIHQKTPDADLVFLPLDLADLASVRRAAELAAEEPRVDVLINNAGVQGPVLKRTAQTVARRTQMIVRAFSVAGQGSRFGRRDRSWQACGGASMPDWHSAAISHSPGARSPHRRCQP